MLSSRSMSVRQKLTLIIFAVSMVVLCLSASISAYVELRHLKKSIQEDLVTLSEILAANGRSALAIRETLLIEKVLNTVHSQSDVMTAYFFYPEGQMVAAYSHDSVGLHRTGQVIDPRALQMEAQQVGEGLQSGQQILWDQDEWLSLFSPVKLEKRLVGYLYLRAGKTRYQLQALWLMLGWLTVLGIATCLSFLLSRKMQGVVSEPIEMLIERMQQVPLRHRHEARESIDRTDEFATLFQGFDEMVGALELRDRQLLEHQQNLEKQVRLRTLELSEAKEEAEAATFAKSRFLANVSHEIRTPMVGILGVSDLLRQSGLPEKEKQLAETVYQSGEALLVILNDLLDLSKAEAGKLTMEQLPFSLQKLAEDVVQMLQMKADGKPVDLRLQLSGDCQRKVVGDPGRLRQILLNLVSNALKFTEKGEILVDLQVRHDDPHGDADVVIAVSDTGIGLRPEDQERIFDSFEQVDTSTTRNYGGTGLGLAIVRQLVVGMGGSISLESVYGEGCCFALRLSLPFAQQALLAEASEPTANMPALCLPGKRVLLAEDNPTTQQLLQIMLENIGLEIHIVQTGREAIVFLDQQDVDLVLMDCQMPEMDGLEATKSLRAAGLQIPVIALTAHAREEDEGRCLNAGMDDFLGKPFRKNELEAILEKWLAGRSVTPGPHAADDAEAQCSR